MAGVDVRPVFDVLVAGDLNALKAVTPVGFDWRTAACPSSGWMALHEVIYGCWHSTQKHGEWLKVATWLLGQGANPTLLARADAESMKFSYGPKDNYHMARHVKVAVRERSAIAVALKLRAKLEADNEDDRDWTDEIEYITQLLAIYTKESNTQQLERVSVNVAVVERWDSILHDTSKHDMVFETKDGECSAHVCVLSNASPVLKALFASSMLEGQHKRIQVKDVNTDAMNFFLEVAYTGGGGDNVDATIAVAALEVAHRWQVQDVVAMIEHFLINLITEHTFEAIARVAQVLQLPSLRSACVTFADSCSEIQEKARSGQLHSAIMILLGRSVSSTAPETRKRKRML